MRFVSRQWGWYFTLLDKKHFKVKLLRFSGKRNMSLQYHRHRNELWLFLSGIRSGEWCIHPQGQKHTYTGGKAYAIEIQYGERCEESDIVRI